MRVADDYGIAFFTNTYLPFVSGVSQSVDLYAKYLRERGDRVMIYAPQYEDSPDTETVRRIPAIKQYNNTDFALPLPISVKPQLDLRTEMFDLVHVHHPFLLGEMGLRIARQEACPLVYTYHTQYERYTHYVPFDDETATKTIRNHTRDFCNMCDLVIAPTKDVEALLRERDVTSEIEILPSGMEYSRYAKANATAARTKHGIPARAPMLLYVGRLALEKNLTYLLEAVLHALEQSKDAVFVVVGGGSDEQALRDMVAASNVEENRVRFLGMVMGEELIEVYAAADLFVFASQSETQGMVLIEAMAGNTPVIVLDADAVRDLVNDNENGRLLPQSSPPPEFSAAIIQALEDKALRTKWQAGARRTAQEFDMPKLAEKLHGHYRSLKTIPRHRIKTDIMSFGIIQSYLKTLWDSFSQSFSATTEG